jgi:hypothetical protein
MDSCDKQVKREHGECIQRCRDERLASGTMLLSSSVNSVQQLRGSDRCYRDLIIAAKMILQALTDGLHRTPGGQRTCGPLELDEDRGV